jgi:hypothetical protein
MTAVANAIRRVSVGSANTGGGSAQRGEDRFGGGW